MVINHQIKNQSVKNKEYGTGVSIPDGLILVIPNVIITFVVTQKWQMMCLMF